MNRSLRIRTIAALISGVIGCILAAAPHNWIELRLGLDLDGGSGLFEFLPAAASFTVGIALAVSTFVNPLVIYVVKLPIRRLLGTFDYDGVVDLADGEHTADSLSDAYSQRGFMNDTR